MSVRRLGRLSFRIGVWATAVGYLLTPVDARAQVGTDPLTLTAAIQSALENYPAIKERHARARAAEEGIAVARTAYLPRVDSVWQVNRATTNNVFGLLLPQSIIPSISGPVLATRSYDSVWGSAAGVLVSWDAVDFGQRKANVDVARAQKSAAAAQTALTALDVASAAADAFLTVLASDEAVGAARANVDRLQVLATSVRTLVANQLRPGADESRADAELAIARNQLVQAVQTADLARAALADATGLAGRDIEPSTAGLARLPDVARPTPIDLASHPAAKAQTAVVESVQARARALERAYVPHLTLQSAFAERGSGAEVPGQSLLGNGLSLRVPNWAVGISATFPAFDVFAINARKRVERQNELAENARYEQTIQTLTTQN
ncbi:MAG: TolC family protein, partial [Vicinamibacterales bacterium]